jgi:hypothetical protein
VISKPYTLTLTLSLKGEGINGWALIKIFLVSFRFNEIKLCCSCTVHTGPGRQQQGVVMMNDGFCLEKKIDKAKAIGVIGLTS